MRVGGRPRALWLPWVPGVEPVCRHSLLVTDVLRHTAQLQEFCREQPVSPCWGRSPAAAVTHLSAPSFR